MAVLLAVLIAAHWFLESGLQLWLDAWAAWTRDYRSDERLFQIAVLNLLLTFPISAALAVFAFQLGKVERHRETAKFRVTGGEIRKFPKRVGDSFQARIKVINEGGKDSALDEERCFAEFFRPETGSWTRGDVTIELAARANEADFAAGSFARSTKKRPA